MKLLGMALAPVLICLFYIYIRDKYEKEPVYLLVTGVLFGIIIAAPIVMVENFVTMFIPKASGVLMEAFYLSFIVASLVEEGFKYIVLYFLTWKNRNFNEKFDGIVYAVFISLGFAGIENVLYVFNSQLGGMGTAIGRAVFSVPAHGLFGVVMGYYFAFARFEPHLRRRHLVMAFVVSWLVHGLYDFILLSDMPYLMAVFVLFVAYLWITGFKKMKTHVESSPFKH